MTKKLIEVTQKHIKSGVPHMGATCPIARALTDNNIIAFVETDCLVNKDGATIANLPRSAQRFIKRFDNKKPVKPFKFYLDLGE